MPKEIKMPQLSDTMDSGKILTWFKAEGDQIERGDILAEVETDKANLEIESFDSGVLLKIATPADNTANVGDVIAFIGEAGESVPDSSASASSPVQETKEETPAAVETQNAPAPTSEPVAETSASQDNLVEFDSSRVKASPLAKKIASEQNIDLSGINGSGPQGRIIRKDLEGQSSSSAPAHKAMTSSPAPQPASSNLAKQLGGSTQELSKMRATIAKRMQQSMQESPHFYMTAVVNMKAAKELREALKVKEEYKGLSLNHFIIKAAGNAIAKVPAVNACMRDDAIYQPDGVNIGIITALDEGLIIPVIHNTDQLGLMDVALETRALIARARAGRPSAQDLSGGTFSISNMGMFDVENFTAIINPGQGAILAVSSMKEKPVVENGALAIGLEMKVTLSVDHRIIDGIGAAQFLKFFKESLEIPALLLANN